MGISIKNEEVEEMIRKYAASEGLSITAAIERAINRAGAIGRFEKCETARKQALERLQNIRQRGYRSDRDWTRDEMHER